MVKRYTMVLGTSMGDSWQDLEEDEDGEWVRAEDYDAAVEVNAALNVKLAQLVAELEALNESQ